MAKPQFAPDYIDVAERIVEFRTKHPQGCLQQVSLDFQQVNDTWWVVYTAAAYRTADDERPGHGTAWEPIPGRTNFTRDSEVQNAETAAWGRAVVAVLAADTKRGIASKQEVRQQASEGEAFAAARRSVRTAWEKHRGEFDQDAAESHFHIWSQGEHLVNAGTAKLVDYAAHLDKGPES